MILARRLSLLSHAGADIYRPKFLELRIVGSLVIFIVWLFFSGTALGQYVYRDSTVAAGYFQGDDIYFYDDASAGTSTILGEYWTYFYNRSTAASATITNVNTLIFFDQSSAGAATITNQSGMAFYGTSTAASANIVNAATLTFHDSSTAGAATFTNSSNLVFTGASSGGTSAFTNNVGGLIDVSTATSNVNIGSLAGSGSVRIDSNNFGIGTNNTNTTFAGSIYEDSAAGAISKLGTGTLTLSGANTYTGATTISGGTLQIGAAGATGSLGTGAVANDSALVFNRSNALTVANVISGSGSLTQAGTGTLTLSGANTYTGATTVSAGTLALGAADRLADSTAVTVASGATFNLAGFSETIGSLAGAGNVTLGAATLTAGGDNTSTTFSGVLSGTGGLAKPGSGTLTLSGANTYAGSTTVAAGRLINSGDLTSAAVSISSGAVYELSASVDRDYSANVTFSGTGTLVKSGANRTRWTTPAATFALGSGSLIDVQAGRFVGGNGSNENWTNNLSGLNVATGATFAGNEANVRVDALTGGGGINSGFNGGSYTAFTLGVNNGSGTFTGVLANNDSSGNAGVFTKVGTGTQVLTGANTFTGSLTISGGTLQIGDGGTTGSLATASAVNNAELVFNRSNANTYAGAISGTGSVTKSGTGTLTLSGANTYTGATTLAGGTLIVNGSIGSSAVTAQTGSTLGGSGSIGSLALVSGAILSPGNSPGTLSTGSETWNGGATYVWEVNNATGTAGTHYDLLSISGALNIAATSSNRFTLSLTSLALGDVAGDVINFNAAQNYTYTIASTTTGIVGFDASAFTINSSAFSNVLAGGTWSLALTNSNRDLALNFTAAAIPEPSTYAMLFGAAVLAAAIWRRRRA